MYNRTCCFCGKTSTRSTTLRRHINNNYCKWGLVLDPKPSTTLVEPVETNTFTSCVKTIKWVHNGYIFVGNLIYETKLVSAIYFYKVRRLQHVI